LALAYATYIEPEIGLELSNTVTFMDFVDTLEFSNLMETTLLSFSNVAKTKS
jgi:hypothetical protein